MTRIAPVGQVAQEYAIAGERLRSRESARSWLVYTPTRRVTHVSNRASTVGHALLSAFWAPPVHPLRSSIAARLWSRLVQPAATLRFPVWSHTGRTYHRTETREKSMRARWPFPHAVPCSEESALNGHLSSWVGTSSAYPPILTVNAGLSDLQLRATTDHSGKFRSEYGLPAAEHGAPVGAPLSSI